DPTFGNGGLAYVDFSGGADAIQSIAFDGQGRILVAGMANGAAAVARLSADGVPDATFGPGGVRTVTLPVNDSVGGQFVRVAADGNTAIVVAGTASTPDGPDFFTARFDAANGAQQWLAVTDLDRQIDSGAPPSFDTANALVVLPDHSIIVGGGSSDAISNMDEFALVKYDASGVPLNTFGVNGVVRFDVGGMDDINAMTLAGGNVYAAGCTGASGDQIAVAQLDFNGNLTGLGTAVLAPVGQSMPGGATGVAVDGAGKVVVAATLAGSPFQVAAARFNPNGTADTAFDTDALDDGLQPLTLPDVGASANALASSLAMLDDGQIAIAGLADGSPITGGIDMILVRLNGDPVNHAPVPTFINHPATGTQGSALAYSATFSDPGDPAPHAESWTVIDASNNVVATGTGGTFNWTPAAAGTFTVTYTVTDQGGLSGSISQSVVISPAVTTGTAVVIAGVLTVTGTAGGDGITLGLGAGGNYVVTINTQPAFVFPFASVGGIRIDGGDGNDVILVTNSVSVAAEIHGGNGSDILTGGGSNDVLLGEGGNDFLYGAAGDDVFVGGGGDDVLFGGNGRDVLIGGDGSDFIAGNNGDDLLIAGTTAHDNNVSALSQIRLVWGGGGDYDARVNALKAGLLADGNLFDDSDVDVLSGNNGKDWFVANRDGSALDIVLDIQKKETVTDVD
ncbi:MAG TPA: PKD domain-containing protein, partial [Tepidisphaeraceae bacterium]